MDSYAFQNDRYRDNAKRDRERGGSSVRVLPSAASVWRRQDGSEPTEQERVEWSDRYEQEMGADEALLAEHWSETMGPDDWQFMHGDCGGEVGAPPPAIAAGPSSARKAGRRAMTNNPITMSAARYKQIRAGLGLSNYALCEIIGVSLRQAQRYESGDSPVDETVARLLLMFEHHGVPDEWKP